MNFIYYQICAFSYARAFVTAKSTEDKYKPKSNKMTALDSKMLVFNIL